MSRDRACVRGGLFRKLVVTLLTATVIASLGPPSAMAEDRPTREFRGIRGDAWGFMLFPVLKADIVHLMPTGWKPIACRKRG